MGSRDTDPREVGEIVAPSIGLTVNARGVRVLVGHWGVAVGAKTVAVRVSVGANTEGDRVAVERSVDSPVIKEDWVGMEVASGETVMAED